MAKVTIVLTIGEAKKHSVVYRGEEQAVRDGFAPSAVYIPNALVRKLQDEGATMPPDQVRVTFEAL